MVGDDLHGPAHVHLARTLHALRAGAAVLRGRYEAVPEAFDATDLAVMPVVRSPAELVRPIRKHRAAAPCAAWRS